MPGGFDSLLNPGDSRGCGVLPLYFLNHQPLTREDLWPSQDDYGTPVMLPGGEVGTLLEWWNTSDHKEWRWKVEFYNSIRA